MTDAPYICPSCLRPLKPGDKVIPYQTVLSAEYVVHVHNEPRYAHLRCEEDK